MKIKWIGEKGYEYPCDITADMYFSWKDNGYAASGSRIPIRRKRRITPNKSGQPAVSNSRPNWKDHPP
jgi:hypothetical protein